jgi:arsenite methyltransferase
MGALARLGLVSRVFEPMEISQNQQQTSDAFGFKWAQQETYNSPEVEAFSHQWLIDRYCQGAVERLAEWLEGGPKLILDAGCGAGYSASLFFGTLLNSHDYLGVDISNSVEIARQRFAARGLKGEFLQWNIQDLPIPDASVDMIFSEGVMHHTDSTENSIRSLAAKLVPGGRFLFYVYAKKTPIREFCDDHIRQQMQTLSDQEAWEALRPLTQLGINLGKMAATLTVPEDIPWLGIKKGQYDLQRFFYWHVCKLFYHADWTFEEMNHVNFDWYRPLNCQRHTIEQLHHWTASAGLVIENENIQESGITIVARKISTVGQTAQ